MVMHFPAICVIKTRAFVPISHTALNSHHKTHTIYLSHTDAAEPFFINSDEQQRATRTLRLIASHSTLKLLLPLCASVLKSNPVNPVNPV